MEKKLLIYSFPDKNPEYLQPQIDSYKKYMETDNTELIIINSSNSHKETIDDICKNNSIQCITYGGNRDVPWSNYYVEQLNWFRDNIQININDNILFIHSDMFFINKLDYKRLLNDKKIIFNPQYRDTPYHPINDGNFNYFYMWDGVLLFDSGYFNENNLTKLFDWGYIGGVSDVGGKTHTLISSLNKNDYDFFEFFNYNSLDKNILEVHLNGNIQYLINIDDKIFSEKKPQIGNRSFPYENEHENYEKYLSEKFLKIKKEFIDNYEFLPPVSIDIIQFKNDEISEAPIFHFKSGTGYSPHYNQTYAEIKLNQIKKIINREL